MIAVGLACQSRAAGPLLVEIAVAGICGREYFQQTLRLVIIFSELEQAFRDKRRKAYRLTLAPEAEAVGNFCQVLVNQTPRHNVQLCFDEAIFVTPFALGECCCHDRATPGQASERGKGSNPNPSYPG